MASGFRPDTIRRKRNLNDYSGGWVDETSTESCIAEGKALMQDVEKWLKEKHPELM